MKVIVYKADASAVSETNPLPVMPGYDSGISFNQTFYTVNAVAATAVKGATSGASIYITDMLISSDTGCNVQFEDSDGTALVEQIYMSADTPLPWPLGTALKVTESKHLMVKTNVACHLTITLTGFVV